MPAPPERPARPSPVRRDYVAEEAAGRQLTNAHIQFRRGLTAEAETAARAILAVRPADAAAWELMGDIAASRGDFVAACASYQTALRAEPGRTSAESKFGRATLRGAEQQRQEKLGVAYAASDTSLVRSSGGADGRRSALWSALGSALCPGLGQIVGGQVKKGAILVGIYLLGLCLLAVLPHGIGRHTEISPGFWVVSALLTAEWIYAVLDSTFASSPNSTASPEKDGWQI